MRKAGWYVIQVETRRERFAAKAVERVCAGLTTGARDDAGRPQPLCEECFCPRFTHRMRVKGVWKDVEKALLPGYVIAVTADPDRLRQQLWDTIELTKLLYMGEAFVPLRDDERAWIDRWTTYGDRIIPISIAYRKGDQIVVTDGPLKGHEGMITRIIRKRCLAQVELHVNGKKVTTEVGLAVVPEADAQGERGKRGRRGRSGDADGPGE